MIDRSDIIGHGADADPAKRPGIPREQPPLDAIGAIAPPRQQSDVPVFLDRPDRTMPAVHGTAQPPKGLSGVMRKYAYAYPAHWTRHWMVLLVADRVDVVEHRLGSARGVATMAAMLVAGGLAAMVLQRRSRSSRAHRLEAGAYDEVVAPT